ncbi:probable LRR receptor-like serine/threonine-protein kinase At1g56140 [Argentina anserina]|uniref:probable LRR receptor-like serine/threonine-protein kinase At1g56140 n=1 Tax=Argentina anserina TaxID=57926 RepID=UPI002176741E|nr:probable LRR receptor-like serine/threonine-protein kinase At1g56140 [Potentilla anserina]
MRGHLTQKTDVFAFGVVALEIAWNLLESKREVELVDSRLSEFNEEEARRIIKIGLLCTQASPMLRPPMSRVVGMLLGDIEVMTVTSKSGYLTDWKFDGESTDVTSRTTDLSTKGTESSFYNSSANTSIIGELSTSAILAS